MIVNLTSNEISIISTVLNEVYDNMSFDKKNKVYYDNQNIVLTLSKSDMRALKSGKKKILY